MDALHQHLSLAQFFAEQFAAFPQVTAVGISGSVMAGQGSQSSDIDLYVFCETPIPVEERQWIAAIRGFTQADFNLQYWDTGDEWFDAPSGIEVDVMFWDIHWLACQISTVMEHHQASMGYTTAHWHTVQQMKVLFDRQGELAALIAMAQADYPEPLRRNIIEKNAPLLHAIIPAYTHQIEKAVRRGDLVSVNHRLAAYLASYFDILFAVNRRLHPGEKRLIPFALKHCTLLPDGFAADLHALLSPERTPDEEWLETLTHLNQAMDTLLHLQGF